MARLPAATHTPRVRQHGSNEIRQPLIVGDHARREEDEQLGVGCPLRDSPEQPSHQGDTGQDRYAVLAAVGLMIGETTENCGLTVTHKQPGLNSPGGDDGRIEGCFGGGRIHLLRHVERDVPLVADGGPDGQMRPDILVLDHLVSRGRFRREAALDLYEGALAPDEDVGGLVVGREEDSTRLCNEPTYCDPGVERVVWDGDQVLMELRASNTTSQYTTGDSYNGRVAYTQTGAVDEPLDVIKGTALTETLIPGATPNQWTGED